MLLISLAKSSYIKLKLSVGTVGDGGCGAVSDITMPLVGDTPERPANIAVWLSSVALHYSRSSVSCDVHLGSGNARQVRSTAPDHCARKD